MKHLFITAVAGVVLLFSASAQATPQINIEIYDGTTLLAATSQTGGSASLILANVEHFSSIFVAANGVPLVPSPNLNSFTLETSSIAPATLTIIVSQINLTSLFPFNLASSFTVNGLTGPSASVVMHTFIDTNNVLYGEQTLIGSGTVSNSVVNSNGPIVFAAPSMALFSETQVYVIKFGAANESVSLSGQIANVPEPISLAVMGVGLFGIGIVRRAKRSPISLT